MTLTAIICAHNPRPQHLAPTLAHLAAQRDLPEGTEFILIDNASTPALDIDLSMLTNFAATRIVREEKLGLTQARIRGFYEAKGEILLFIDDDNLLEPDYLRRAYDAFSEDPQLGAVGGKSLPRYETPPPSWFAETGLGLACRDLGDVPLVADWQTGPQEYPECGPIGAGMALRKKAYAPWVEAVSTEGVRSRLGRRGADLASGEDNDMVLTLLAHGWRVAYLPELSLVHLIPSGRLTQDYLERYAESSNRTWVLVLDVHGMRPWPAIPAWSVPLRKAKAFFSLRAWRGPVERIEWRGACGKLTGQALLEPTG